MSDVKTETLVSFEVIPPGRGDRGEVLRSFERLRREVSVRVEGDPGMFAGFDHLELLPAAEPSTVPVLVQVSLSRRLDRSHCVDFVALAFEPEGHHRSRHPGHVVMLGQGHGRTLRLQAAD